MFYLAPLQGFTDVSYRNALSSVVTPPDASFSPFIETHKPDERKFRDINPLENKTSHLIPQILGNKADEIIPVLVQLTSLGYQEVNWNLGCPYPMVTKRNMGAGLLPNPSLIDQNLDQLFKAGICRLSVKMRLGLEQPDEWKELVPILNRYPISEVIVHARIAKQLYKGDCDLGQFKALASEINAPICYNGNIFTLESYQEYKSMFPEITRWMFGRGVLMNPLLIEEIRCGQKFTLEKIRSTIQQLHDQLLYHYSLRLNGNSHILNKIKPYWEYFSCQFTNKPKGLKKIKKSMTLDAYQLACKEVFRD